MEAKVSYRSINKLAFPAMISGLAEPIISLTDIAIIGGIPENGNVYLGAVGVAGSVLSALIWVFAQSKSAISAYVSKAVGAKDISQVPMVVSQLLLILTSIVILTGLGCFALQDKIFQSIFELNGLSLSSAKAYFEIRLLGLPFTILTFSLFGLFRGLQNTSWAMIISLIGGVTNILLDLLLIKGWFFPSFGVVGASWASVASQFVMLILAVCFLFKKTNIRLQFGKKKHQDLGPVLWMTFNFAIRTISLNVALLLANKFASSYGKIELAVHTVLFNLWLFTAFLLDGFANAGNAIGGKLLGENNWNGLVDLRKKIVLLSFLVASILGIIFFFGKSVLGSIFIEDSKTMEAFVVYIIAICVIQPFNGLAFGMDGIFKGLGKAKFLRNLLLLATFIGFVPSIYLGDYLLNNLFAVWIAFGVWMLLRSIIPWFYFDAFIRKMKNHSPDKTSIR